MFDINTKVQWRTGGRGVFRTLKGVIIATVKAGKLPIKSMQDKVPHGNKLSNRDRYIVEVKDGVFAWANVKSTFKQDEKMPPAKHRFGVPSKPKDKAAKKVAKVKAKKAKAKVKKVAKAKKLTTTEKDFIVADKPIKPLDRTSITAFRAKTEKKSGGDKPKTTWYGIVDGKVVSVRKVLCPAGYSKDKPVLTAPIPEVTPEVAPAAEQPAALPQAV